MSLLDELSAELPILKARVKDSANWTDVVRIAEQRIQQIKKEVISEESRRKQAIQLQKMLELEEQGLQRQEIARRLGLAKSTVTRVLGRKTMDHR